MFSNRPKPIFNDTQDKGVRDLDLSKIEESPMVKQINDDEIFTVFPFE